MAVVSQTLMLPHGGGPSSYRLPEMTQDTPRITFQGAGIGVLTPTKNPCPTPDEQTRNNLLSAMRAPAEREGAMFKHFRALQRVSPGPRRHHRDHGRRPRHHHPLARFLTRTLVRKAQSTPIPGDAGQCGRRARVDQAGRQNTYYIDLTNTTTEDYHGP